MIRIGSKGTFRKTQTFLSKLENKKMFEDLDRYGRMGVDALRQATPRDSGATAEAWFYGIARFKGGASLYWNNSNDIQGAKIAILIQYGHGTGTGGFVSGTDYINPALKPIFDQIAEEIWKKVTNG